MGLLLTLALLALPARHQIVDHNVLLKLVRAPAPVTDHERKHRARPRVLRLAADVGWIAYIAGAVAAGLMFR